MTKKELKKVKKALNKLVDRLSLYEGDGGEVHHIIFGDRLNPVNSLERYIKRESHAQRH